MPGVAGPSGRAPISSSSDRAASSTRPLCNRPLIRCILLENSLSGFWSGLLLIIAAVAQLFCGYA
ncbi:hypothetical protein, partial [Nocardia abscessus]|uniref:hypothetical protein n=1 Tax=Nocardia abscessus TaxID=120957 RepID=UPI002457E22B